MLFTLELRHVLKIISLELRSTFLSTFRYRHKPGFSEDSTWLNIFSLPFLVLFLMIIGAIGLPLDRTLLMDGASWEFAWNLHLSHTGGFHFYWPNEPDMTVPPCYCVSGWQAKSFSIVVSIQFSNHNVPNASEYLSFRIANCASDLWFCPCWKWCTPNCHLYRMMVLQCYIAWVELWKGQILKANVTPKVLPSHLHVRRARCFFFFSTFWSNFSTVVNWDL